MLNGLVAVIALPLHILLAAGLRFDCGIAILGSDLCDQLLQGQHPLLIGPQFNATVHGLRHNGIALANASFFRDGLGNADCQTVTPTLQSELSPLRNS